MSSKYVLIVSLFCVLLTSYVQCQTNEESEDPSEGQESTGNEEEPQSMADAYLDYISGGHKADGESSQFDDIGEGLDQAMEGSGPTEDSSTMDMLLRKFIGTGYTSNAQSIPSANIPPGNPLFHTVKSLPPSERILQKQAPRAKNLDKNPTSRENNVYLFTVTVISA